MFEKLSNIVSISKTIRFKLIPVGKTLENIEKLGKLEKDFERSDFYPILKNISDDYYRQYIKEKLSDLNLDWQKLYDAHELLDSSKKESQKNLEMIQAQYRKVLFNILSGELDKSGEKNSKDLIKNNKALYGKLFKKQFILEVLPDFVNNNDSYSEEDLEGLNLYSKFTTRLKNFWETRKNVFTDKDIVTAIPFRAVNENFGFYYDNIKIFNKNIEYLENKIPNLENELKEADILDDNRSVKDYFTPNGFNYVITQDGIDVYQAIRGGFTKENGEKVQGINEILNLTQQQLRRKPETKNVKLGVLKKLRKQILEYSESTSFLIDQIEDDNDLVDRINKFNVSFFESTEVSPSLFEQIERLYNALKSIKKEEVYIDARNTQKFSQMLFGQWDVIRRGYTVKITEGSKEEKKKYKEYLELDETSKAKRYLNIREIEELVNLVEGFEEVDVFSVLLEKFKMNNIERSEFEAPIYGSPIKLEAIKEYLEKHLEEYHKWKLLLIGNDDLDTDETFYPLLNEVISDYYIIPLYNLTRNYLTRKHSDKDKIKVNFDFPTLADGWSESKISDNRSIILRKDGYYYLGILEDNKLFNNIKSNSLKNYYEIMRYNLFPDAAKMIPKCSISKKEVKNHFENGVDKSIYLDNQFVSPLEISKELYELQNNLVDGKKKYQIDYLRNTDDEVGYKNALVQWITFCKDFLLKYQGTQDFDYSELKEAKYYDKLDQFYADVDSCGYNLDFDNIDEDLVNKAVEDGKLLIFQIYNKDFSPESKGKKNLHTLYWLSMFSEENLRTRKLKLNGQAEIFYRKKLEKKPIIHKEGSILLNKIDKEGNTIPENIYHECYRYLNKKIGREDLSDEAIALFNKDVLKYKEARFDIIKDRRYSESQFFFHVPITFNWDIKTNKNVNQIVQGMIKDGEIKHIIGIDRGERHLLYYSVIDLEGNIVEQGSLNTLEQNRFDNSTVKVDYQNKLRTREEDRDRARKNWTNINKIKELKDGYLSHVVHKLSRLIIKYEAIVIMENLNQGFKRGRFKVERQVYQKFELALMNKLSALSFKEKYDEGKNLEPSGILNPIQACYPVDAYQELQGQNGIVFYLPAAYTSVIDPVTGFTNLFRLKSINSSKYEEFIKKFKNIYFDNEEEDFKFIFNYKDFAKANLVILNNIKSKDWKISTRGERISYNSKKKEYFYVQPTEFLINKLKELNIDYENIDIIPLIDNLEEKAKRKILKALFDTFKYSVQLRNYDFENDYIISPTADDNGNYYNSNEIDIDKTNLPNNGDANGAFNIARKGLLLKDRIVNSNESKVDLKIKNEDWINFIIS
ncbi:type V CRISPR-associated protein Cas12a/Cpf1 [Helcococcus kunzii]|uniref:type V CRISPR-associated protein Cas12a/Cpf1 n=1 Tax=Helcococcus kunzii TaxID=40091 RepID=UPI00389D34F9